MDITIDVLKRTLPAKLRHRINDELLEQINDTLSDPNLRDIYRDNFITYSSVLNDGKYKVESYLKAVKYCTHKLMGQTNIDSYIKTFPDRYNRMLNDGISSKDIASVVSVYNRSKLVNAIMEQSLIPSWIINQDLHQKAINVLADLMCNAQSEKVRADSASSLLTHLKPPETKKVELDIGLKENKEVAELKLLLADMSAKQLTMIEQGNTTIKDIAETKLIKGRYEEV